MPYRLLMTLCLVGCLNASSAETSRLVENLEAGKTQTVVAYGTSLTAVGAWVHQLQTMLEAQYPGQTKVFNSGGGGCNSAWGRKSLDDRVLKHNPDTVFIEFSVNDSLNNRMPLETARANLEEMIDRILGQNPECEIILMVMNPAFGKCHQQRPNLPAYDQIYREVARERGFKLIDHAPAWQALLEKDPGTFIRVVPDTIHPVRRGALMVITPNIARAIGLQLTGMEQSKLTPCWGYLQKVHIDKDKNAECSKAEFTALWSATFGQGDANRDGAWSREELGPEPLFEHLDADDSDSVSLAEFLRAYASDYDDYLERTGLDPDSMGRADARGWTPGQVPRVAFDGDVNTKWLDPVTTNSWIQYRFDEPVLLESYEITSANDGPFRDPTDWTLLGSQDGEQWETIDERQGERWPARLQMRAFEVEPKAAYTTFRLHFASVRDPGRATCIQLAEIAFKPAAPLYRSRDGAHHSQGTR